MYMHNTAYVALGSNLPFDGIESPALLARAVSALQEAGLGLRACSGIWRTAAWPPSDQPDYYNAVVALDPGKRSPQALYEILREVEARYGRERREKWASRTLDLDIVAIDDLAGTFGAVTLPHPHMHERAFVLAPLIEIAPKWRHPLTGETAAEILAGLPGGGYRRVGEFPASSAGDG
jgi:2-amino-4-hydroxy-6-hydroxymethyldihydropteridine diphosphokinase